MSASLSLLVALALAGQTPTPTLSRAPVPPRVVDLAFVAAQEDWVHRTGTVRRLDQAVGGADAKLVRRLGCPRHECREEATALLRARGDGAARALLWGAHCRDAEVRDRCERLWRALFACPACHGTGGAYARPPGYWDDGWDECPGCDGTGDLRWEWRTEDGDQVARERDLP